MKEKKDVLINLVTVLGVLLFVVYNISLFSPPEPLPKEAPLDLFSAQRAMVHIETMCQKPHPMGTTEHKRVREYIISQAQQLGLQTETQVTVAFNKWRDILAGKVHNIIATLKGKNPGQGKALLIVGHYDTQPHTPGAADDGSAVAAMLECARALNKTPALKNDVIFLFTDGEESGLLGAKAFVDQHPLLKRIGMVVNLEARGNCGPVVTFEVSPQNGWIIPHFARAVSRPYAASIMYEVYKTMPNDTDFTVFKNAGLPGLNSALLDGFVTYHSMTDSPKSLHRGSLQHHGDLTLQIARHFGNLDLSNIKKPDVIFFNPIGSLFISYSNSWQLPSVVFLFILYGIYLFLGLRKKRLTLKGIAGGLLLFLLALGLAALAVWLLQLAVSAFYPQYAGFYLHNYYNIHTYFVAFSAVATAVFYLVFLPAFSRLNTENLFAGFLFIGLGLTVTLYLLMPTAAYLILFPVLFGLIGGLACFFLNYSPKTQPKAFTIIRLLAVLPVLALFTPMIQMLFLTFGLKLALLGTVFLLLLLGFLLFQLKSAFDIHKWALPFAAFALMAVALVSGHFTSHTSQTQPLPSDVMYSYDADNQTASWTSRKLSTDDWNKQFFPAPRKEPLTTVYPWAQRLRLIDQAPVKALPVPQLTLQHEDITQKGREMKFHFSSSRGASLLRLIFSRDSHVQEVKIDGISCPYKETGQKPSTGYKQVIFFGLPAQGEGLDIQFTCKVGVPLKIIVLEGSYGLPSFPQYTPLPPHIIPATGYESHLTLLKKTFQF